jgi:dihydroflavonol-4-reductase
VQSVTIKSPSIILVTGGTGLVGSHLLKQLVCKGHKVRALYRTAFPKNLSEQQLAAIEWVKGDIMDVHLLSEVMEGIQQLYHAAALVSFNPARKKDLFRINIEGTSNVVNAALEARVEKMVYVSSVAAMGRIRTDVAVNETMFWTRETSNSNYGQSKYLAELEVWRGIGEGLNAVIVNPTLILGAGDWENGSSKMFKTAFDEFPWYTEGASGFVDVRDVVKAMTALMEADISGERFILNAENRNFKDVFTLMSKEFGKRPPHKKVNPFLAGVVWRMEWLKSVLNKKEPLLTRETAKTGQARVEFDNSKLKKFLPAFQYIPIDETIRMVCGEILKTIHSNKG